MPKVCPVPKLCVGIALALSGHFLAGPPKSRSAWKAQLLMCRASPRGRVVPTATPQETGLLHWRFGFGAARGEDIVSCAALQYNKVFGAKDFRGSIAAGEPSCSSLQPPGGKSGGQPAMEQGKRPGLCRPVLGAGGF